MPEPLLWPILKIIYETLGWVWTMANSHAIVQFHYCYLCKRDMRGSKLPTIEYKKAYTV